MNWLLFAANGQEFWQNPWLWGSFLVGGVILLIFLFVVFSFLNLWIQCWLTGADVSIFAMIRMKLTKLDPAMIVREKIKLVQAGVREVTTQELESHALAK